MQAAHTLPQRGQRSAAEPASVRRPAHVPRKSKPQKSKHRKHTSLSTIDLGRPARIFFFGFILFALLAAPYVIAKGMLEGNNAVIDRLKTDINNNVAMQQKEYIELTAMRDMRNIEFAAVTKYGMTKDPAQTVIMYPAAYDAYSKDRLINLGGKPSADYRYLLDRQAPTGENLGLASFITNKLQVFENLFF